MSDVEVAEVSAGGEGAAFDLFSDRLSAKLDGEGDGPLKAMDFGKILDVLIGMITDCFAAKPTAGQVMGQRGGRARLAVAFRQKLGLRRLGEAFRLADHTLDVARESAPAEVGQFLDECYR